MDTLMLRSNCHMICHEVSPTVLSAGLRLEFLSLQRCFQAKDDVLCELLDAAASSTQTLRCIAVSHLQLSQWAANTKPQSNINTAEDIGASQEGHNVGTMPKHITSQHMQGSRLYALALHNCHSITSAGLQAVATACPQLQMLFLGGSTLSISSTTAAATAAPQGQIPLLNSVPRSRAAAITTLLQRTPARWHPAARQIATQLAALAQQLPQLMLLEITFLPHGVRQELKALLEATHMGTSDRAQYSCPVVHVLDLCECSSIAAAATRHSKLHRDVDNAGDVAGESRQHQLRLLLEAAANCSNVARQTPLHVAVDSKDAKAVEVQVTMIRFTSHYH